MGEATMDQDLADLLGDVDKDIAEEKDSTSEAMAADAAKLASEAAEEAAEAEGAPEGPPVISDEPLPEEPAPKIREKPRKIVLDSTKDYLKKVIEGETGEYTDRLIDQLDKAINSPVREDRTLYRQRLMATYWNFLNGVAEKVSMNLSNEKIMCIRYGIADITLLKPHQIQMIEDIPMTAHNKEYPFYYMDEWLKCVASGQIKPSMMDETIVQKTDTSKTREKLDRKDDSRAASLNVFKAKANERDMIEKDLQSTIGALTSHTPLEQYDNVNDIYTPEQKNIMTKVNDDMRKLKNLDNYMLSYLRELRTIDTDIENLKKKMGDGVSAEIDSRIITNEFNSLRQMVKMCAGPRGNHFPILISDYAPPGIEYINTRENVIKLLQELETKDQGVFNREFKGQTNRIIPFILLLPGFGEKGICWEPFDIKQRATSRGRIALPLYPRNPMYALLNAVADLRWQVAKEKAGYRWMEEGLTGKYYDYFTDNRLKGNIKSEFIKDYMIWVLQEWNGTQKLERDVRFIFWRHIPFPQSKKDELKNRGFFYNDLYKRDMTRAMSDGY